MKARPPPLITQYFQTKQSSNHSILNSRSIEITSVIFIFVKGSFNYENGPTPDHRISYQLYKTQKQQQPEVVCVAATVTITIWNQYFHGSCVRNLDLHTEHPWCH